ncbi:MAG: M20/M25/M40 family metallo-hydrolase [Flavobacteriaceae bacterium]|nr:M20/M25/M40 family metallo-hydrolase [Flavobacteriaceae bacterium]
MKILKKALLVALTILVAVILYNTFIFESKQISIQAISDIKISEKAKHNLAKAIRIKTISPENPIDFDSIEFNKFKFFLKKTYPLIDSLLELKTFNKFSYLYKWQGSNSLLKPIILMAHTDVVPVISKNKADWKQDAFAGIITNNNIWGRGAIDDKNSVIAIMESVESLLEKGFKPQRSIYIALGHDEEIGGLRGAKVIAKHLESEEIIAEFIMDEGGIIAQKMIPGIDKDVALIGIAEKGFLTLILSIKVEGGHSSMPAKETAIDIMSKAIYTLKQNPFPSKITPILKEFINHIGPEMPFANKMVFANSRLFSPLILNIYEANPSSNSLVRTTTAPTIFNSGVKENIIPQFASASVNFRILPGESTESVILRVTKIIDEPRINITPKNGGSKSSKVSQINTLGYNIIHKSIAQIYPKTIVSPYLVVAGTDAKHYSKVSDNIYRFSPIKLNKGNIKSFHGLNEKISIKEFEDSIIFYTQIIKNSNL